MFPPFWAVVTVTPPLSMLCSRGVGMGTQKVTAWECHGGMATLCWLRLIDLYEQTKYDLHREKYQSLMMSMIATFF
jgi:hypothetical protein